ncbi:LysM peptidoglycan-binding domain-containing protein [Anaerobacillus sp. MEB173]|uniref:LysM peptidoglycan-binding domain-containing protein n=1 Tax=Anaerobacillus sp. MEB173 TaxID=3383345 RepID=UPI003F8E9017
MQLFYTVRPGDTLYEIARRWELPLESLIAANNLNPPYTIYVGQQLSVPPGVDVIRVRPGDSVFKISQSFRVPQAVIIEANRLQPPYVIQVGQLLHVPPGVPYYVVQPGDTLFLIALRFNVVTGGHNNAELIKEVNRLPSYTIYPGMKLIIPYAPSGDRGLLAYISNRGGQFDLWIYHPSSGINEQVTNGLGESYSIPFWSPDSRRIAFVGKNRILYVFQLGEFTIASIDQFEEGLGIFVNWSRDSQKLVYIKGNNIVMYDIVTHQVQRIHQPGATDVQWFPSGVELLFQAPDGSGVSQLFRMRTNGTGKQQITRNTGGRLNDVRLSPDGSFALYTTPGVSISIIHTLDLTTGNVVEVRGGPLAKNYFPVWSPDSSTIAYSATAYEDRGYFSLIRTTGKQGENDVTRAISDCFATPVTWSPDGRKIAYLSGCNNQGSASEIWLLNVHQPVPIRLVEGGRITSLQWSPSAIGPLKRTYTNPVYNVQFQYPSYWRKVTDERYEGPDGFFQISAISSEQSIHEVCQGEAFHKLLPYGTEPQIITTQIQNQEACFIYPSEDQPVDMKNQAALIIRYPTPIQINGATYNFFILWGDQNHLFEIGRTLSFV